MDKEGNAKGSLNCHVNNITVHHSGNGLTIDGSGKMQPFGTAAEVTEPIDNLPF